MKTEQLQSGQGAPELGASHRENSDLRYKDSDLTGGGAMYQRGLAERAKVGGPGNSLAGLGPEMGGGGDAIDDWVVKKGGYENLLQQIQQNGWGDDLVWELDDRTKLSVAEVKRRAAAASEPAPMEQKKPIDADAKIQKEWMEFLAKGSISIKQLNELKNALMRTRVQSREQWDSTVRTFANKESDIKRLQSSLEAEIIRRQEQGKQAFFPTVATSEDDNWRKDLPVSQRDALLAFERRTTGVDPAAMARLAEEIVSFQVAYAKTGVWPAGVWVDQGNAQNFLHSIKDKLSGGDSGNGPSENRRVKTTGVNRF